MCNVTRKQLHEALIELKKKVQSNSLHSTGCFGMCSNIYFILKEKGIYLGHSENPCQKYYMKWEDRYTLDPSFPVEGNFDIYSKYHNKWDIKTNPYAQRRLDLLQFMIRATR